MKQPKCAIRKRVATASVPAIPTTLLDDLRHLIEETRQGVAIAVNAALTLLYWRVGKRINEEILQGERAGYGKQILAIVSQELPSEYGQEWGEKQLQHCLRTAETFPDKQIVSALMRQLGWTHFLAIRYVQDSLQWVFTLRCVLTPSRQAAKEEIMNSMLSGFAPLRENILEARVAKNVAKLLEGE